MVCKMALDELIDSCCYDASDFALATILYNMYKDHVCDDKHSYKSLSMYLSLEVAKKALERSMYWNSLAHKARNAGEREIYEHKSKNLNNLFLMLRSRKRKDEIIKEYNTLYNDKT